MHKAHPEYPVQVPELLRFGIMHNRSVGLTDASEAAGDEQLIWDH